MNGTYYLNKLSFDTSCKYTCIKRFHIEEPLPSTSLYGKANWTNEKTNTQCLIIIIFQVNIWLLYAANDIMYNKRRNICILSLFWPRIKVIAQPPTTLFRSVSVHNSILYNTWWCEHNVIIYANKRKTNNVANKQQTQMKWNETKNLKYLFEAMEHMLYRESDKT